MKKSINILKTFILIIIGGFLMAFTDENKGKAKLVFLHERSFWGDKVEIKINNQKIANLSTNNYFEIEVDADNLNIIIDRDNSMGTKIKPDIEANLLAEPDKIYYLKIYREVDYFTDKLYLVRISEQTAKRAMKSMKLEQNPLGNE
ncbi:MAG: hypothetical protein U5N85_14960 [Arcicella sp.]|nr:hypothetical protein [Arcicella sp.]